MRFPKTTKAETTAYLVLAVSLIFFCGLRFAASAGSADLKRDMLRAFRIMEEAESALRSCGGRKGIPPDEKNDPNRTGLMGVEASPITTTLGGPEAKRTTANPEFAALLVLLLNEAGVRRGDAVAIGASGSFPALLVASLAAAGSMDLKALVICSLAASQWGANRAEFTALDMMSCLSASGVLNVRPLALSVGGEKDVGEGLRAEGRRFLEDLIRGSGVHFINESRLSANVRERIGLYEEHAGTAPIRAFINIGGGWANIGEDPGVLELRPGLVQKPLRAGPGKRGVLQEMLLRGVPAIHLLNIRGLCERYGLPWDPASGPNERRQSAIHARAAGRGIWRAVILASYLALAALIITVRKRRCASSPDGEKINLNGT